MFDMSCNSLTKNQQETIILDSESRKAESSEEENEEEPNSDMISADDLIACMTQKNFHMTQKGLKTFHQQPVPKTSLEVPQHFQQRGEAKYSGISGVSSINQNSFNQNPRAYQPPVTNLQRNNHFARGNL